jgi:signal transduction histidine kinase
MAIAIVALSLGVAAVAVFETLLLTGNDRLDESLRREMLEVREHLALKAPGVLTNCAGSAPSAVDVTRSLTQYLNERDGRADDHMIVARIGGRLLSTADAPRSLELLRDRGQLPVAANVDSGELSVVDSAEGEIRMLAVGLCVSDDSDASVSILGPRGEIRGRALVALGRLGSAAGVGLLLAGTFLGVTIRRILRPLNDLARAARSADLEDLGERVELHRRSDEVGQLAREFNRMLDRIESSVGAQRRFMAAVSHELRTPITIARGHLDLLDRAGELPSRHQVCETTALVRGELVRMQRLVADLMALGRADDDDFVVRETIALRDFFDELQLRIVGFGSSRVRFEPVPDVLVHIDRDRLAQAVLNLVANAEAHAGGRSETVMSAEVEGGRLLLIVSDDGTGIEPAIRDRAFEPLVHSGSTHDSIGLGLSVVQAITAAHGGEVHLDSGNWGTTITIAVPAGGSDDPA